MIVFAGSYAGGASPVAATVLPVRRADGHTVPEDRDHFARWIPHVDPGRRGRRTGPRGRAQIRSRVRHHPVRHTRGPIARAAAVQVRCITCIM